MNVKPYVTSESVFHTGADLARKLRGGDFSYIWQSTLITGPLL